MSDAAPRASVIVSAYNKPIYLVRTLEGLERQTVRDFEIIIADDGSDAASREIVDARLARSPLHVRRVWQRDDGFRKTMVLNKALAEARADYLIFTDGDCVPFPEFVAQHLALRAPGRFLSAGAMRLGAEATAAILGGEVAVADAVRWPVLKQYGVRPLKHGRMFLSAPLRALLDAVLPIKKTFNGLNASCWRADAERIGGFNERMGYGGEDVEFGRRLEAIGVMPRLARHRIRALHLDHDRPYATQAEKARNRLLLAETLRMNGAEPREGAR